MKNVSQGEKYATWRYNKALEENRNLKEYIKELEAKLYTKEQQLNEKREVNENLLDQISYLFSYHKTND